jgi:hypothetical protein
MDFTWAGVRTTVSARMVEGAREKDPWGTDSRIADRPGVGDRGEGPCKVTSEL